MSRAGLFPPTISRVPKSPFKFLTAFTAEKHRITTINTFVIYLSRVRARVAACLLHNYIALE